METVSLTSCLYLVTFIDDFSRYTIVYFLKQKSKVVSYFKECCLSAQQHHDLTIEYLWLDNGGEYISKVFQHFCKFEGIKHQFTIPYTPQQNGVAERKNRTLIAVARAMLLTANLPNNYWEEAVATTANLRQKLDSTSTRMIFVGYGDRFGVKAYRFFDLEQRKFLFAHSVYYYDESSLLSVQQGDETAPLLNPSSQATPQSNQEVLSLPQLEWEESKFNSP
ncbi:hypothetical protein L7F22_056782 [Adiantum nelumboides]|nr:hypothetical protein [Adiantum nelumboides]